MSCQNAKGVRETFKYAYINILSPALRHRVSPSPNIIAGNNLIFLKCRTHNYIVRQVICTSVIGPAQPTKRNAFFSAAGLYTVHLSK